MNCKITTSAATKMNEILAQEEDKNLKFRVFVAHIHGNHAHYGLGLDYQKDTDEFITTDHGVEVLLEKGQVFLDGIEVNYDTSNDTWSMTNPSKGNHDNLA